MLFHLVLRTGVVAAVVLATKRLNIWDSTDDSVDLYNSTRERASSHVQNVTEYLNIRVPDMPAQRQASFLGVYYYNQAVMTIFEFIGAIPTYVGCIIDVVPGFVGKYASQAKDAYDEYQLRRAIENEKQQRRIMIDEKPLIQPLEPSVESKPKSDPGLLPREPKNYCVKVPQPEGKCKQPESKTEDSPKCNCAKCKRREAEGWSDNRPKCPQR